MKRSLGVRWGVWFLAVLMVALAGCGGQGRQPAASGGSPGGSGFGSKEPIKIGMLIEQTGAFSWYGEENLNGAKLVVDEVNKRGGIGGRQVELVIYNTESSPEKAINGAKKLMQQDKVAAIIGLGLVSEAQAVAPIVEKGPPTFALSGAYKPGHRFMFGGTVFVGQTQERALRFLSDKGLKKIALITTNDATGQQAEAAIKAHAAKFGAQLLGVWTFNPTDVDVTAQLTQIKAQSPDAIVSWTVGKPLGVVLKGAKQLGIKNPIITSHGNLTPDFLKGLSDLQNGPIYVFGTKDLIWREVPESDPQYKIIQEMQTAHQKAYGKEGGIGTGTGYDAMKQVLEAIEKVGTDPDKIVEYIEGLKNWVGVVGVYNFSKDDHRGLTVDASVPIEVVGSQLKSLK